MAEILTELLSFGLHKYGYGTEGTQIRMLIWIDDGEAAAVAPENLTAPTILGDPVVGQVGLASPGTYDNVPTSFAYQWYESTAGVGGPYTAVGGFTGDGDAYLFQDADAGAAKYFKVGETASNSGGSAPEVLSAEIGPVTQINLTGAITSFTRTSASGVVPMTWSLALASNVYAGYYLLVEVFPDFDMVPGQQTQSVYYQLTHDDVQPANSLQAVLTAAGLTAPTATQYMKITVFTTSPNGLLFADESDGISPTDAIPALTLSPTDKTAGCTLSGGNLTATHGGADGVRSNRAIASSGLIYFEYLQNSVNLRSSVGFSISTEAVGTLPGFNGVNSVGWTNYPGSYAEIDFGGANVGAAPQTTAGDIGMVAIDMTSTPKKMWVGENGAWQGGITPTIGGAGGATLTGIATPLFVHLQSNDPAGWTMRFTLASQTYTLAGSIEP